MSDDHRLKAHCPNQYEHGEQDNRDELALEAVYIYLHQCQVAQAMSLFRIDTHHPVPSFR
jgi:hypothetical protein